MRISDWSSDVCSSDLLMHGDHDVSTKNLARQIGAKKVGPCKPEIAQRHSGYLVGGTSPFATRKKMPVWVQVSLLDYPVVYLNGGRRGYLIDRKRGVEGKSVSVGVDLGGRGIIK